MMDAHGCQQRMERYSVFMAKSLVTQAETNLYQAMSHGT